ncbi:MAG: DUF4040 domain-containing protein [Nanoarchaeota archaeon]|nr:DUF4040 domain-containing protein [Nanoarchaeota archaeon]MBU1134937.1 DUF4040 domain-containing protein [Nanoarchaeota archaeon]MBU2519814.1 DUF4040 domain-containing protein [Nanoarchaeota archaeon]
MIFELLLIVMIGLIAVAINLKDLVHAVIVLASADVIIALIFLLLAAPDIAITQVAIASGLTSLIFIVAIRKSIRREE